MSLIKKKSQQNQTGIRKNPKQNKFTYISLEKIWDLASMRLVNRSAKKKSKKIQKYLFIRENS